MKIRLTIDGHPKGKGRPKFTRQGNAYTPRDTKDYEDLVKLIYRREYGMFKFSAEKALDLRIRAFYPIPKSDSKALRMKKFKNEVRPNNIKPDIDNVVKIICDALNGVAFSDDTQIVDQQARKFYSNEPRVEVLIREADI